MIYAIGTRRDPGCNACGELRWLDLSSPSMDQGERTFVLLTSSHVDISTLWDVKAGGWLSIMVIVKAFQRDRRPQPICICPPPVSSSLLKIIAFELAVRGPKLVPWIENLDGSSNRSSLAQDVMGEYDSPNRS